MKRSIKPQWNVFSNFLIFSYLIKPLLSATLVVGLIICLTAFAAEGGKEGMKLDVKPHQVLLGDPISVNASGLSPGQIASLRVLGRDQFGNNWSSEASFQADANGYIDPSRQAPVAGTYDGVDGAGLFWSMTADRSAQMVSPFPIIHNLTITLCVDGLDVEDQTVQRIGEIDVQKEELTDPIIGVFIRPMELTEPTPAVIVLGGSDGGYQEGWAKVIASKTRMPTLALAYFGIPGLPPTLENIPLETVEKAIDWLSQHPMVDGDRIGIVGASRGGEMGMLAASLFPQIKAVVGYTPSGVVWEGIGDSQDAPAWTYQGKAIPYLLFMESEDQKRRFSEAQRNGTPYLDSPNFIYSLEMQRSRIDEATIPVENSQASFLLIANPGDGVWPSDVLSQIAIERLRAHNYTRSYSILSYDQGGHMLIPYPYYPTTLREFYLPTIKVWEGLGGTPEGAAKAALDSWLKTIAFLKEELGGPRI